MSKPCLLQFQHRDVAQLWLWSLLVVITLVGMGLPRLDGQAVDLYYLAFIFVLGASGLIRLLRGDSVTTVEVSGSRVLVRYGSRLGFEVQLSEVLGVDMATWRERLLVRTQKQTHAIPFAKLGGRQGATRVRDSFLEHLRATQSEALARTG